MAMKQQQSKTINPYLIISGTIFCCWVSTFFLQPAIIQDGVYIELERNVLSFQSVFNLFRSVPLGMADAFNLMTLICLVGSAMEVYSRCGALSGGIHALMRQTNEKNSLWFLALMVILFSALGGFLGWMEVLLPFAPLVVAMILALGYDNLTAVAVMVVGCMGGFMGGPTNLYTVGICNGIMQKMGLFPADGDLFAGLWFRLIIWGCITVVSVLYVLRYAIKVRQQPSAVPGTTAAADEPFTWRHAAILSSILVAMLMTIWGMKYGIAGTKWTMDDVSAIFFCSAVFSGIIGRLSPDACVQAMIKGIEKALPAALIIGLARSAYWIISTSNVNASLVHYGVMLLNGLSPTSSAWAIFLFVAIFNGVVTSASGKAALLTPVLMPVALSLGLSDQTAVLCYQFGDGITHMLWFTYGTLLLFLNYGNVSLSRWYKFYLPLMGIYAVLSLAFIYAAVQMNY